MSGKYLQIWKSGLTEIFRVLATFLALYLFLLFWENGCCLHRYIRQGKAAIRGVLCKKMFLEISQNSQENTCARVSFLVKLQASGLQLY